MNGIFLICLKKNIITLSGGRYALFGFFVLIFAAGCTTTTPVQPSTPPTQKQPSEHAQKQTPKKSIALSTEKFPGIIAIHANSITKTEKGFAIPVFLSDVSAQAGLDTVALQFTLHGDERLTQVKTTSGFTAQLDKITTNTPTVYYLPSALSADAYTPVVAQQDPLFTLYFTGKIPDTMTIRGSFFVVSGTIFRTNTAKLLLK